MKAWTLYLPLVNLDTYGAPRILQIESIRSTAIELCERARVWRQVQAPVPLSAGILSYQFNVDQGTLVHTIMDAHLLGNHAPQVHPRSIEWCNENYPGWQDGAQTGKPTSITQLTPDEFIPVPSDPGLGYQMVLTVALKPTRDSTQGPDFLFNDYYDAIVNGTRARLMAVKDKPWSNPTLAVAYANLFDEAVTKATRRAERGFGRARHRVKGSYV